MTQDSKIINTRKLCLSTTMLDSEKPIVYSLTSENNSYRGYNVGTGSCHIKKYCVTVSQSQGFMWNQDLFANQYQQNYRVEYDSLAKENSDVMGDDKRLRDDKSMYFYRCERVRRKSENCISLTYESQNGTTLTTIVDEIEIDSDTPENIYIRSLVQ
ncbi:similar to Saccharomyces cerevisiae YDL169C UGX2 Protein of unknown function, transcript accumulates in response to any combination of stress conditions [Maudiozyma barnettii]|uniref:Uncharacterized protein n=1 Tax=Maudiozyma barnettii TaxID=61262 RepID=A0A8H2ZFW4_9SACH|nr:Ugx2p [Kazachstania barnettii]CAB4252185.1 similar to Saccharomyces cerevisiae YDL169C UGX2 Protein of unknown function, transcript accumulates in response to any combination of stress conditions [Kazachstania barnettii]CAD1778789.1 similar to Saccharomyces cerevisiae YDL169C UGX2 Protein of unknown function, transcript accumulates in response to any combination of stress conditions [Kazachstania barnettii]